MRVFLLCSDLSDMCFLESNSLSSFFFLLGRSIICNKLEGKLRQEVFFFQVLLIVILFLLLSHLLCFRYYSPEYDRSFWSIICPKH